ncbi:acyloxyacyl hydrolase [Paraburkholderia bengalensis]|uniref:Lipid A deacylase n=1 Tax=Paraburkholderia bengalensis TaxID=2747562 RepID=A0ABU8J076_9BURK
MRNTRNAVVRNLISLTIFASVASAAQDAPADSHYGFQFAAGVADHGVRKADIGGVWDPGLGWWEVGGYYFTLVGEAHVAYWDIWERGATHSNIWEFGLTPVFRVIKSTGRIRPYVEAGVGVRLLSHVRETEDRTLSSFFQFADMAGVGAQFGEHQSYQAGFRFQHLSNAGIKHPNPGINFSQIYFQYNF